MTTQKIETVGPELAQQWLEAHNQGNRKLRPSWVRFLADQIKAGRFQLTHQGIAFASNGRLLDGQHRLAAIVQAGLPVVLMVTRGLDEKTFLVIDQGAKKSSADIFGLDKKDLEVVRAAAQLIRGSNIAQADVEDFIPAILPLASALRDASGTTAKVLSCASTKLGAVVRILEGEDRSYVLSLYANVVNERLTDLPCVAQQFVLQASKGAIRATDKANTLAKAMIVFDKAGADKRRLLIQNPAVYQQRAVDALNAVRTDKGE